MTYHYILQEPWDEQIIKEYVTTNYTDGFELFSKVNVNGGEAHPLFKYLKSKLKGTFGE